MATFTKDQACDHLDRLAKARVMETQHRESYYEAYDVVCRDPVNVDLYKIASGDQLTEDRVQDITKNIVSEDPYRDLSEINRLAKSIYEDHALTDQHITIEEASDQAASQLGKVIPFDTRTKDMKKAVHENDAYADLDKNGAVRKLDELAQTMTNQCIQKSDGGALTFLECYEKVCDMQPALLKRAIGV